jgi:hypothetical protein
MVMQEEIMPSIFSKMRNYQIKKTGFGVEYGT